MMNTYPIKTWLIWLVFLLLFTQPLWFTAIAVLLGIVVLLRGWRVTLWPYVVAGLFGAFSQILGPVLPYDAPSPPEPLSNVLTKRNLIAPYEYQDLSSWDSKTLTPVRSRRLDNGYLRVDRYTSDGREFTEIVTFRSYAVEPGQTYTLSFYFRSDGFRPGFMINFITPRGYVLSIPNISYVGDGLYRASASIKTDSSDTYIRGLNLVNFSGQWSYLDIGFIQLEAGSTASGYVFGGVQPDLMNRIMWWVGSVMMGYLLLLSGSWLIGEIKPPVIVSAALIGLIIQVGVGLFQLAEASERASGLFSTPNLLGHFAVTTAALVWLLCRGSYSVLLSLGLSFALVWLSESRSAFLVWGLVLMAFIWDNRKHWLMLSIMILLVGTGISLWNSSYLGRLVTVTDLGYFTTQARLQIWDVAQQAFTSHPWTGIGFNRFTYYYLDNLPLNPIESTASHTHNLFWQLLSESGLLGITGFAILWGWVFLCLIQIRKWRVLGVLAMVLILNVFDMTWHSTGIYSLLWLSVAAGLSLKPPHSVARLAAVR